MAKKKAETAPESNGAASGKITQKEAVKQAIAAGKDSPSDGVTYVKEQFGISLNNGAFSTIKSQLKKAGGSKSAAKRGRPKGGINPIGISHPVKASSNGVPNVALSIEAIKTLVDQLGVEQVVSIARLFAK